MMSRETYYTALFGLLQTLQGKPFQKIQRKLLLPANMNAADYPALFMVVHNQPIAQGPIGLPGKHTLGAMLYLYTDNPAADESADPVLNGLLDTVEAAILPAAGLQTQTLGGLVHHCWMEGTVEVFSGPNSQFAAAIVPVKILVP